MNNTSFPGPVRWTKSTYSGGEGGNCIEWAPNHAAATGEFLVRDSKNPHGPRLTLTANSWAGLIDVARDSDV
ncbi:DUF397 domain-containing protein [Streptomyces sp. NPDC087294]|uniref:DUF397 domain-containing protein n=1 Tax=Streptomyces sp. NPDC087294 TaxID=3365777 RepID=UPI00381DC4AD